jgi:all-trans-retinol 13,14-reductase
MNKYIFLCCLILFVGGCFIFNKRSVSVSAKQNWVVVSDPTVEKKQNEYDVIVVGAGIGGLSTGSLLSKSGYKVLVLEQQGQVGGYCTSYSLNGFTFPVGAHDISGCDQGAVGMLLDMLKLKREDLFALHMRTYVLGDTTITFTGTKNDVVERLSGLYPDEKPQLIGFFKEAERAFDEARALRKNSSQPCPTYKTWQRVSYQQKLDEFFSNEELKKFLCSLLGYIGTKSDQTAASEALTGCLSYFIYGGHYPKHGGKLFADALKHSIESYGGTVLTNTKVDEILVADTHVTGVRSGDRTFFSSLVVDNANAKTVFLKMLPSGVLDPAFLDAICSLKMSKSEAVVNLGVDLDLSSLSSIVRILPQDLNAEKCSFFISSNADPETAPKGCSSVSIGIRSSYSEIPSTGTSEYKEYKEKLAQLAIEKLEKVLPGLSGHILVKDVITPRTYESFTSMPEGSLYSFDQSKGSERPYFKTPIQGLYLASASTLPGAGVEAVVASGLICARDILRSRALLTPPENAIK